MKINYDFLKMILVFQKNDFDFTKNYFFFWFREEQTTPKEGKGKKTQKGEKKKPKKEADTKKETPKEDKKTPKKEKTEPKRTEEASQSNG